MNSLDALKPVLSATPSLAFAVLVGSRANGTAHAESDWDIAVMWDVSIDWMESLAAHETLRRALAASLNVSEERIDLIDLARANLAMRANVAEDGVILAGEDSLSWVHFLNRTWRELESFYWEQAHAA